MSRATPCRATTCRPTVCREDSLSSGQLVGQLVAGQLVVGQLVVEQLVVGQLVVRQLVVRQLVVRQKRPSGVAGTQRGHSNQTNAAYLPLSSLAKSGSCMDMDVTGGAGIQVLWRISNLSAPSPWAIPVNPARRPGTARPGPAQWAGPGRSKI